MKSALFAMILTLFPQVLLAISQVDVIQSSFDHFPKVLEAIQNIEIEQQKLVESQGAFDGKLKGSVMQGNRSIYAILDSTFLR